ncbi:uncharacterized protein LOC121995102 [Zingiber officinale]|uniref:uncharacterized protein LOC121995102 n=1 Tax=Zingiber officinale TaxID=94328 RepID=UPI001C4ADD37|nr:uncharacterized protein LOC121995102 [Zingiber officinale]
MGQIKLAISLERPALHEFRDVVSTFHQKIKFPVGEQVEEVRGEQRVSRRCYIDMVRVEARKNQRMQYGGIHTVQEEPLAMAEEPIPWEEVQLYVDRPESLTRLASDLPPLLKEELVQCLIHNRDVFAWSTEELPGVRPERRFLLVAVDYFSKWVEVEALAKITEDVVIQFLWKNILCRFGIPHKLVSDNGRQFQGKKIQAWCKGFGITQAFSSMVYPQSNGQTKVVNREIVRGLKVKLDHVGGNWVEELSSILWAYRTTPRESTGLTPFHLVYANEVVVPIEIGVPSVRRTLYDEGNAERRLTELDLISETRDRTAARLEAYRERMR